MPKGFYDYLSEIFNLVFAVSCKAVSFNILLKVLLCWSFHMFGNKAIGGGANGLAAKPQTSFSDLSMPLVTSREAHFSKHSEVFFHRMKNQCRSSSSCDTSVLSFHWLTLTLSIATSQFDSINLQRAHLWVQVVPPILRHSQLAIGQTHVVQVSPKAVVGPCLHHVATWLVEALRESGRPWWREKIRMEGQFRWTSHGRERTSGRTEGLQEILQSGQTICVLKFSQSVDNYQHSPEDSVQLFTKSVGKRSRAILLIIICLNYLVVVVKLNLVVFLLTKITTNTRIIHRGNNCHRLRQ